MPFPRQQIRESPIADASPIGRRAARELSAYYGVEWVDLGGGAGFRAAAKDSEVEGEAVM